MVFVRGFFLFLLSTLAGAQLSPELMPHKAPKPALPKIDENACPFEGCQFGQWKARETAHLFSTWNRHISRRTSATLVLRAQHEQRNPRLLLDALDGQREDRVHRRSTAINVEQLAGD